MALADSWYTSGTFWAAAGAVAVLLTGTIATYVAFILASPVRHLECSMSTAPLLQQSAQDMPGHLKITWDGAELVDPSILEVTLVSRGRRDIAAEDFDGALEFRVGARILAILRTASGPHSAAFRAVAFDDDLLKVGPGLIRRHQSIKLTLLASGRNPTLTSSMTAVRDVDVVVLATDQPSPHWSLGVKMIAALAVAAAVAGLVLIGFLIGRNPSPQTSPPVASHTPQPAPSYTPQPSPSQTLGSSPSPSSGSLQTAEKNLESGSQTAESSGISALQRIINSSPGEQPAAIEALAKFIRINSPTGSNDQPITAMIQTALNVLIKRNPANDHGTVIDLSNANLTNAQLSGISLISANLVNTDFDQANLNGTNLRKANLNYAFFGGANLGGANLESANLAGASFYDTIFCHGPTPTEPQRGYNCSANG